MKKIIKYYYLFIILSFSCSTYIQKPTDSFYKMLERDKVDYDNVIHFDGGYSGEVNMPERYIDNPIFFFKNGLVLYHFGWSNDSIALNNMSKQEDFTGDSWLNAWGVYRVEGDKIKAIIYIKFMGVLFKHPWTTQCYFEGLIVNKDTIKDWHMVSEPYLKNQGGNEYKLKLLKQSRDLYFKNIPIKDLVNPEDAWINEFKDNKKKKKRRKKD